MPGFQQKLEFNRDRDANDALAEKLRRCNQQVFGFETFRSKQLDIVTSVMKNDDVYVIMPTGGGKSLCYALPAVLSPGVTVVISPLLSLIEDQVSAFLKLKCGGIPSAYLTSTSTQTQKNAIIQDLQRSQRGLEPFLKLLYMTPERVVNDIETQTLLKDLYLNERLARFIVDESHCVSQWGHDFRKDYAKLSCIKEQYPDAPIVALTATAAKKVSEDTLKLLRIIRCKSPNEKDNLIDLKQYIENGPFAGCTGIVYCLTRKECEETALALQDLGVKADYYHAGMPKKEKQLVQGSWLRGTITVVCATIAYGMGIDKADVRYVLHTTMSKSLEAYYQEAGRAGRDGNPAECILYHGPRDVGALKRLMQAGGKRISNRDLQHLEDMELYCQERDDCRRRSFMMQFGQESQAEGIRSVFRRCSSRCDNCLKYVKAVPEVSKNGGVSKTQNTTDKKDKPKLGFIKAAQIASASTSGDDEEEYLGKEGLVEDEIERHAARERSTKKRPLRTLFATAASHRKKNTAAKSSPPVPVNDLIDLS
eukprot:GSChrysophyteH1.ASY1.ANO1.2179.1 assembled CDS